MLVVKREIVKFKMFLVKRRKAIEKMIKKKNICAIREEVERVEKIWLSPKMV